MLGLIVWVFILVLALSYFGISIQEIVNSPAGQANIAYLTNLLSQAWHSLVPYIEQIQNYLQSSK